MGFYVHNDFGLSHQVYEARLHAASVEGELV